jgi:cytoskeletal protein CcmA (bactofilin family)
MHVATRLRSRLTIMLLVLIVFVGGVANRAEAAGGMRGDKCVVGENEHITEDFYFLCRLLDVKGSIDGDLIGVATQVTIHQNAEVTGEVWVAGGKLLIEGTVGNDVHFAGASLVVADIASFTSGKVDVASVALNTEIQQNAVVPGDLLTYGYQANIDGTVGGDVNFAGEALVVNGVVAGNIDAKVGDARRKASVPDLPIYDISFENRGLQIGPNALIGGNVSYRSATPSQIPGGVVQGRIRFQRIGGQPDITKVARPRDAAQILRSYLVTSLRDLLTLMIVGLVGLLLVPNVVRQPAQQIQQRTIPAIGWGLATFMFSIPVVIMVVLIGLVVVLILYFVRLNALTLMVGIGLVVVSSGMVGGIGFLLFFMGRVVVSFMIGQLVYRYALHLPEQGTLRRWASVLLIGAAAYALLTNVPVPALGLIIELVTALAGVGAVVMYLRSAINVSVLFTSRPEETEPPISPLAPPAPEQPEGEVPSGLENLPEGFSGFDEDW